mmetsp:Transcript_10918/g.40715  ORF Transcript_10918/g.40715 Transcript_10918/m.40715 type:complete len:172 (-) Transcript_10918:786-1301(-)
MISSSSSSQRTLPTRSSLAHSSNSNGKGTNGRSTPVFRPKTPHPNIGDETSAQSGQSGTPHRRDTLNSSQLRTLQRQQNRPPSRIGCSDGVPSSRSPLTTNAGLSSRNSSLSKIITHQFNTYYKLITALPSMVWQWAKKLLGFGKPSSPVITNTSNLSRNTATKDTKKDRL